MANTDEQNRKQLEKVVLDYLKACAFSYEEVDEGEYEYAVNRSKDQEEPLMHLGISLDEDGSHYQMYADLGPFDLEGEDTIAREMPCLLNRMNTYVSGSSFYSSQTGNEVTLHVEREYDTFDGMPTMPGLFRRLQDLIASNAMAISLFDTALEALDDEDGLSDEDEDDDDADSAIPFPLS